MDAVRVVRDSIWINYQTKHQLDPNGRWFFRFTLIAHHWALSLQATNPGQHRRLLCRISTDWWELWVLPALALWTTTNSTLKPGPPSPLLPPRWMILVLYWIRIPPPQEMWAARFYRLPSTAKLAINVHVAAVSRRRIKIVRYFFLGLQANHSFCFFFVSQQNQPHWAIELFPRWAANPSALFFHPSSNLSTPNQLTF